MLNAFLIYRLRNPKKLIPYLAIQKSKMYHLNRNLRHYPLPKLISKCNRTNRLIFKAPDKCTSSSIVVLFTWRCHKKINAQFMFYCDCWNHQSLIAHRIYLLFRVITLDLSHNAGWWAMSDCSVACCVAINKAMQRWQEITLNDVILC